MSQLLSLRIAAGPHAGEERSLGPHETLVVGRATDASWPLDRDPYFSRYHFRIECDPPECRLSDLESRNGTSVNGSRVATVALKNGDRIECGETVFLVCIARHTPITAPDTLDLPPPERGVASTMEVPPPTPPQKIAEFSITRELGRGTMGVVYHAVQETSGREAALKIVHPVTAAQPEAMQLFLREASILSQLRHPRIVEYLGLGLHNGQVYFAMEYLPTLDVAALLGRQSRPRQVRVACGLITYVLEALQFAHERDLVHRDVKPSNLLVYLAGKRVSVKLADFGLAKNYLNAGLTSISRDNQVRGTLAYMAPEQLINCRYAKPPCDIYGAGACLYYFLSGAFPYDFEEGSNVVAHVLNLPPVPLADRSRDLPLELTYLVDRALARDPADRFSSAEHMRKSLLRFVEG